MSKCRITILLFSVEQEKTCFNPLIVVNDTHTIAELVKKALELYTKNAKLPRHDLKVLALNTINAGVLSTIADDGDLVSDVLGERATLTVVVKDAINLMEPLARPSTQLLTPVPSTSSSVDLNAWQSKLQAPPKVYERIPKQAGVSTTSKKRKISTQEGPSSGRQRSSKRREQRRALQTKILPESVQSLSVATNSLLNVAKPKPVETESLPEFRHPSGKRQSSELSEAAEDGFQFTRPSTVSEVMSTTRHPDKATPPSRTLEEVSAVKCLDESFQVRSEEGVTQPCEQVKPGSPYTCFIDKDKNVLQSQTTQQLCSPKPSNIPNTSPNVALTATNLQLSQQQISPSSQRQSSKADVISVASSSVHSSHILKLSEKSADLVKSTPCPPVSSEASAVKESGSEPEKSETDSSLNSELLNFLSPSESHAGSTAAPSPVRVASIGSGVDDSSDSSSMKSGEQSSSDTSDDGGDASEAEVEPEVEPEAQSTTFLETARSSPVTSQVTDPYPELEADNADIGQPQATSTADRERYLPMRPGLRTTYRPLSFLHEQSLREKDDLSKLAQSPSKMSMSQILPDTRDEVESEVEGEDDDTDSSTTDSDDSDLDNNVPAEKRARPAKQNTRKRQSQGARGLLEL
ncbi:protein of unknown function [Taphrina deformans PYCC 5710]|uniref:Uncharacterized protein n=1 Tax=Taphrina deformans (strain PYCC 5710 / ATCC 11124 / CBS 356.35 / IMI 108563 / JCM 9778 / NBRC 8474) TaxID=1097556 RepID=R4X6L4_TAPDE|nr:protein of unknown function [Taphrina deformans PYCC 5710]|eukprot:CCG80816.1 protein of unknown function [Taphrina deformans PYCC 5710]